MPTEFELPPDSEPVRREESLSESEQNDKAADGMSEAATSRESQAAEESLTPAVAENTPAPTEETSTTADEPAAPAPATASVETAPHTQAPTPATGESSAQEPTPAADAPSAQEPTPAADAPSAQEPTPAADAPSAEASDAPPPVAAPAEAAGTKPGLKVGDRIRGRVLAIGDEHTTLDCGEHGEARIATTELKDRQGDVLMRVDDKLTATVSHRDDGILLTLGKKRGVLDAARLRLALENRSPVKGTVQNLNKGGFEIRIGRVRAFCPLSQIDAGFVDHPQGYLGKSMTFRVLRWENHGRNIVVSRRSILREEAKQLAQETRKQLSEGAELQGVVKRMQPFGAFVDLGGLEGLLHVSRMSHARIDDPTQLVKLGDTVRVRVVKIEHPGTRRERIALALADLGPDPWEAVPEQVHVGDVLTGTVARLVPFGAFVHLPQGVDGLVHVSELSPSRVTEPKEVVTVGQEVQVRVLHVDLEKRRISLSLRRVAEPEHSAPKKREPRREKQGRGREKPAPTQSPGSVSLTYTMAEQLGSLKQKLGGRR